MGRRTLVAGYPTRTAAIVDLIDNQKMSPPDVALKIGVPSSMVRQYYNVATKKRTSGFAKINVPLGTIENAEPHAAKRGISSRDLCRRILCVVFDENMVDAILDDDEAEMRQ